MAKNANKTLSSVEVQNMLKDIRKKIKKGVSTLDLKHYLSDTYGYTEHTAECYISKARKELKEYYLKDKEHFAEEFYQKYNYLYQQSIENNNLRTAKDILDSMVKLTGAGEFNKQKVEFDGEAPIVISFGFDKNEEE